MKSGIAIVLCSAGTLLGCAADPPDWASVDASQSSWWQNAPTASDYIAVYPARALRFGISGQANLVCLILPDRHLNCVVEREAPPDLEFGKAALFLSRDFVVKPDQQDPRLKIGSRIMIPIIFSTPSIN